MATSNEVPHIPLIMKLTSELISWDPDDEVGKDFSAYFQEAIQEKLDGIAHLTLKPDVQIADLELLGGLDWEDGLLEIENRFQLEAARLNNDNQFTNQPSCEFEYRFILDLDLGKIVPLDSAEVLATPEIFVDELCRKITIGVYEFPYSTKVENLPYDEERGQSLVAIEVIEFMGDTFDVVVQDM